MDFEADKRTSSKGKEGVEMTNKLNAAELVKGFEQAEWKAVETRVVFYRHSGGVYVRHFLNAEAMAKLIAAAPQLAAEVVRLEARVKELETLLAEANAKGLIYWEPQTTRGHINKAELVSRIEQALAKKEGE
jgi:hypothetical protein